MDKGEDMLAEYRDLCTTCNNKSSCMYRKTRNQPVFFCEQFDPFIPVSEAAGNGNQVPAANHTNGHLGLCSNCEHQSTCMMSTTEGGIWHCEEYR